MDGSEEANRTSRGMEDAARNLEKVVLTPVSDAGLPAKESVTPVASVPADAVPLVVDNPNKEPWDNLPPGPRAIARYSHLTKKADSPMSHEDAKRLVLQDLSPEDAASIENLIETNRNPVSDEEAMRGRVNAPESRNDEDVGRGMAHTVEVGDERRPVSKEERQEKRARLRGILENKFPGGKRVEGTKGISWYDPADDSAIVDHFGDGVRFRKGGAYNFGSRDAPNWKRWGGRDEGGWLPAGPADIQRARAAGMDFIDLDDEAEPTSGPHAAPPGAPNAPAPGARQPAGPPPFRPIPANPNAWRTLPLADSGPARATPTVPNTPIASDTPSATIREPMILEESLKYAKEAPGAPAAKPEEKPTTKDAFRDQRSQDRFAKMLKHEGTGGEEVARLLLAPKEAKAGDLAKVEAMRVKYAERINGAAEIAKEISLNTIDDFAAGHPDLQRVINTLGKQEAVNMVHKWLPEIAVDDPTRFQTIQSNFHEIVKYREKNTAKTKFEKLCKDNKLDLDSDEFAKIMQNPDAKVRKTELRNMVREHMGGFRQTLSAVARILTLGQWSPVKSMAGDFEKMKKTIEKGKLELTKRKQELGQSLGLMFDENDEVREALFLEMQGQKSEPKEIMNIKEARSRIATPEDAVKAWETYKTTPEYTGSTDKQASLDNWQQKHLDRAKGEDKGGGIWGEIARIILELLFNTNKAKFTL